MIKTIINHIKFSFYMRKAEKHMKIAYKMTKLPFTLQVSFRTHIDYHRDLSIHYMRKADTYVRGNTTTKNGQVL